MRLGTQRLWNGPARPFEPVHDQSRRPTVGATLRCIHPLHTPHTLHTLHPLHPSGPLCRPTPRARRLTLIGVRWFLCLFAADMEPELTANLWDFLFTHGAHLLFGVALGLLAAVEDELLVRWHHSDPSCWSQHMP